MTKDSIKSRIISAIAVAGSGDQYGPDSTLLLMSELAQEAEFRAMSLAFLTHQALHPGDRDIMLKHVPGKVLHQFLGASSRHGIEAVQLWQAATPDWEEALQEAIGNPDRFETVALTMDAAVQRVENR